MSERTGVIGDEAEGGTKRRADTSIGGSHEFGTKRLRSREHSSAVACSPSTTLLVHVSRRGGRYTDSRRESSRPTMNRARRRPAAGQDVILAR